MEHEVMNDLNLYGAEHWETVVASHGHEEMLELVSTNYLRTLDTPIGIVAILGPKGRKLFERDPSYVPEPTSAASQVLRRHVIRLLERENWHFDKYLNERGSVFKMIQGEHVLIVYANWNDPSVTAVRNLLNNFPTLHTLVAAHDITLYQKLQSEHDRLRLLKVDLTLPPRGV
jgi:hypothetical protein